MNKNVIPIFRIFDYKKAIEFYVDWLGFKIDWEERGKGKPIYMQVSKNSIKLHLTEHHGDCCPGSKVFIVFSDIKKYHERIIKKDYKYNKPELGEAPWNATVMQVTDPFGNKLLFNEYNNPQKKPLKN